MERICECWLIDESVSKYGLTSTERKLAMMEYAEGVLARYAELKKTGLTEAETQLRLKDKTPGLAEAIERDESRREALEACRKDTEKIQAAQRAAAELIIQGNIKANADPEPSRGSEAAEIEMLVARKASHYVHKKDIHSGTDWDAIMLLCGRPAMNSGKGLGLPAMLHRIARYGTQERASCEDCVRIAGCVPVPMVERDIF